MISQDKHRSRTKFARGWRIVLKPRQKFIRSTRPIGDHMFSKHVGVFRASLLCLALLAAVGGRAIAQGGQVLYNGIVLPQPWPPIQTPTQAFQTPSYLAGPPSVIPIDL